MRRSSGAIRLGVACAFLFASLSLVVWRQSRALEELRSLDGARTERALLHAQRLQLQREIQRLESRARIVAVAGERLGLRVPSSTEIVILREPTVALSHETGAVDARRGAVATVERR